MALSFAFGAPFSVSDILPPMSFRAVRSAMVAPMGQPRAAGDRGDGVGCVACLATALCTP